MGKITINATYYEITWEIQNCVKPQWNGSFVSSCDVPLNKTDSWMDGGRS